MNPEVARAASRLTAMTSEWVYPKDKSAEGYPKAMGIIAKAYGRTLGPPGDPHRDSDLAFMP